MDGLLFILPALPRPGLADALRHLIDTLREPILDR
jgi:hypothetical protein